MSVTLYQQLFWRRRDY